MSIISRIRRKVKDWVSGGSSKSSSSGSFARGIAKGSGSTLARGASSSRSYRDYSGRGSGGYGKTNHRETEEERKARVQKEQKAKRDKEVKELSAITDAKSSGKALTSNIAKRAVQDSTSGMERVTRKIGERAKATPPDPKEKARKDAQAKRSDDRKSFDKATHDRYNVEKNGKQARVAQKMQVYDPEAEKWVVQNHPIAESPARGAVSGVTFGSSELLARRSKNRQKSGAEEFYQKNKSAKAEIAGEIAGSLVGFGLTEAGATKLAGKVAPKALKSGGEKAVEYLAKNPAFRKAALKEAERTGINVTEEVLDRFVRNRAERLVGSIGADMAVNMTTGKVMDINLSLRDTYDENDGNFDLKDFAKNYAINAAMNYGIGGAVTVAPALRTSKGIFNIRARDDAADLGRRILAESDLGRRTRGLKAGATNPLSAPKIGESLDRTIARRSTQTAEQNALESQLPQMRQAMNGAFTANADEARRVDMNEILAQNSPFRQADEAIQQATRDATPASMTSAERTARMSEIEEQLDSLAEQANRGDRVAAARYDELRAELEGLIREEERAFSADIRQDPRYADFARHEELTAERDRLIESIDDANNPDPAIISRLDEIDAELNQIEALHNGDFENARRQIFEDIRNERINEMLRSANEQANAVEPTKPKAKNTDESVKSVPNEEVRPQNTENITPPPVKNAATSEPKIPIEPKGSNAKAPNIKEETVNAEATQATAEAPRVEPPTATAEAPNTETPQTRVPRTKEEAIRMARESQTRQESESLLRAYFDENGEVDLGKYGQVAKNSDDTYTLTMDGVGEVTLSKAEVEKRIRSATRRAYEKPRIVDNIKDVVYKRRERLSNRKKIEKAARSARTLIADSLSSFEDVERKLAKAEHRQVDYGAINAVRTYQARANRSLSNHQVNWLGDKFSGIVERIGADGEKYKIENGKSLAEIYKGMDEATEADFDLYLELRHAPYRLLHDKPVFENIIDRKGLNFDDPNVCKAEADKLLKEHPEFAKKAEEVYQYTQNELKNRVDAGLLKQETVDKWNEMYPYYVPTGREGFNEIHGINGPIVGAEDIRGATGSDRNIMSIRDQLSAATTRNWRDMTTNEMFKRYFNDKIAAELAQDADGGIERVLDNTINLGESKNGQYYADIYVNGKKHTVDLEEQFYEGLKDLYKNGRIGIGLVDATNDAFSKVATYWKNLITEWNPIFIVSNFTRDMPEAFINTKQTKEFVTCMPEAAKDLARGGPYSQALRDAGISQSTFIDIDKAIREGKDKKSFISRANEVTEMYPRLVEYMATLKKGGIDITDPNGLAKADKALRERAAANAADVTVNFGRSGSMGKAINKGLVPFFNPSVQGWSKFLRNFTERDLKSAEGIKETLSFLAKATALGAGATTLNNFLLQDNPNYQMISARDKATNYIIPIGDPNATDTFAKIPRARFSAVYGLPAANLYNENDMGWAEMFKIANDQVAPIDPLESTLFSPFVDAGRNKTWYGSPIVPGSLENPTHPSEEYDQNTSWFGKQLGKATENLPKELQISPKKADYIIDAETGVVGDFLLPMTTQSRQGGGNNIFEKAEHAGLNVLQRKFSIDSTVQNDLSSRFYEQLQTAGDNKKSAKATEADAEEYTRMSEYSTEISGLTKAINDMQSGSRPDKQDAIRGLQKVRNQLMQDALDGKPAPTSAQKLDAVQKYVGTSYAIKNFGSTDDQNAMKAYGLARYGKLSDEEMAKRIDDDKDFYKGVRAIGQLEDELKKNGAKTSTVLTKAIALASAGANDDLFGAYKATVKSRTESANEMDRAKLYIANGGSTDEFVKLEVARKTLGKLSEFDKEAELDKLNDQLARGEISYEEYHQKQGEAVYNANISYVGLATSLAEANAPARGYQLYDIKAKNIQKGINLAAMGFTARDYREMAKAVDADGNGYPKKQEIMDYVAKSDVEDKATLFDALYYYKGSRNPFGTPTNYTREQAAAAGKAKGVKQITDETGDINIQDEEKSSGYGGYRGYRRGYRRWHRRGHGSSKKATVPTPKALKASDFKQGEALVSKKSGSSSAKVTPPALKRVKAKIDLPTVRKEY